MGYDEEPRGVSIQTCLEEFLGLIQRQIRQDGKPGLQGKRRTDFAPIAPLYLVFGLPGLALGQDGSEAVEASDNRKSGDEPTEVALDGEVLTERQLETLAMEGQINENPDAQRRVERETQAPTLEDEARFRLEAYGSVRLHAINTFQVDSATKDTRLGDGASRVGVTARSIRRGGWCIATSGHSGIDALFG